MKANLICTVASVASVAYGYTLTNYYDENDLISSINNEASNGWIAGTNSIFDNMNIEEIRGMMGTIVAADAPIEASNDAPNYEGTINSLPKEFDSRQRWGACIHPIRSQLKCGSCWSFAATEALSDRFCILGKDVILSPQYLVSCDQNDGGCNGGRLSSAWSYMHSHGISTDSCVTYVSGNGTAPKCMHSCTSDEKLQLYKTKNAYSVVNFFDNNERAMLKIMAELYLNGPIEAGYNVYQDFLQYKGGVYKHRQGNMVGGHAVKIIGWGDDPIGGPYWTIANSWGEEWGEGGFFRIARGHNECGIERDVWAGIPDIVHTYDDSDMSEDI